MSLWDVRLAFQSEVQRGHKQLSGFQQFTKSDTAVPDTLFPMKELSSADLLTCRVASGIIRSGRAAGVGVRDVSGLALLDQPFEPGSKRD